MIAGLPYVPAGLAAGALIAFIFRVMPPAWLLDYGEADLDAARRARDSLTFFPGILFLVLADGFLFGAGRLLLGSGPYLPVVLYLVQPLLLIIVADLKTRIIPDQFILALLPGGVLLWVIDSIRGEAAWGLGILTRLLAALLAGLVLFGSGWLGAKLMKREAMGMGDVKLLAACAFVTGLKLLPFLFCLAFLTAALVALPVLVSRLWRRDAGQEIAFGPYIALATLLLLLAREPILGLWQAYLDLLA